MKKFESAEINLRTGINLFFCKNFTSCITLVGASHEVFDTLLKNNTLESSIEFLSEFTGETKKRVCDQLNFAKNWIKHADRDIDTEYEPSEDDCVMLIALSIPAYFKLGGSKGEETEKFRAIYEDFIKNKI